MASTQTLLSVVKSMRAYPELVPILGQTSGWTQEPALTIANDVMQKFLSQNFPWKFNRAGQCPFLTVALQQDYVSNLTNLAWLEEGWRLDINNSSNPGSPKPIFLMETVRDLAQTSFQANPFNCSWVPNTLAIMGTWMPNMNYSGGYGVAMTPQSPKQQFVDANGNILFINSFNLGLTLDSPGVSGSNTPPPTLPGPNPYGTSGSTQPVLPANSAPGTTVQDGTMGVGNGPVTWTVADPDGIAFRTAPVPATSGIVWYIYPVYQKKPPILTSLQDLLTPIPDEYLYLFRQGFLSMCYGHAGSPKFKDSYQMWEEALYIALRAADREREDACFYPSEGIMGGSTWKYGFPVGPAWPYDIFTP